MRDRLVELLKTQHKADYLRKRGIAVGNYEEESNEALIADFLLANGVIVPPCKVGEVVWLNTKFGTLKARVTEITQTINNNFLVHIVYDLMYCYKQHINTRGYVGYVEDKFEFGKTVYHTKEEAEQALKGGAEK